MLEHNLRNIIANNPLIIKTLDNILKYAVYNEASDIHFEKNFNKLNIRYRINNQLTNLMNIPDQLVNPIVNKLKEINKNSKPIYLIINNEKYIFSSSIIETSNGEKIVLNIKKDNIKIIPLEKLGLISDDLNDLVKIIKNKTGLIIINGEKLSGKTTTTYSLLEALESPNFSIGTVELNIERRLKNISQIKISEKEIDREKIFSTINKQDFDILLIDEIKNEKEMNHVLNLSSNKLVITTLDQENILDAFNKLLNLNPNIHSLKNNLKIIINQKIFKKICQDCSQEILINQRILNSLKDKIDEESLKQIENKTMFYSDGCIKCNYTGHKDNIALFEVLKINNNSFEALYSNNENSVLDNININLEEQALIKCLKGEISINDLI